MKNETMYFEADVKKSPKGEIEYNVFAPFDMSNDVLQMMSEHNNIALW